MAVFANCDQCGAGIYPGQNCYSLHYSLDHIESEDVVLPLHTENIVNWCADCAPEAIQELKLRFS